MHEGAGDRTYGTERIMSRTRNRSRTGSASAIAVLLLAASACSSADSTERNLTDGADSAAAQPEAPAVATTVPERVPQSIAAPDVTEAPTTTEQVQAPVLTTEAEVAERAQPPEIVVWRGARAVGGSLTASWTVTPDDAVCSYDLLDDEGTLVGTGVADTSGENPVGRGILLEEYEGGDEGSFVIRCSVRDSDETSEELGVHTVNFQNRHPDSVIPATDDYYFDHDEVAALFPECGPRWRPRIGGRYMNQHNGEGLILYTEWLDQGLDFWQHEVYANWDTETHEIDGKQIASGWWTTEQLRLRHPDSSITAATAREEAFYNSDNDLLWVLSTVGRPRTESQLNRQWRVSPIENDDYYLLEDLYHRLNESVGYVSSYSTPAPWDTDARWIRDASIGGTDPNPKSVHAGALLYDWIDARYRYAPIDREPAAWAMRTLLETRGWDCVARLMRKHCDSGDFHPSFHMRHPSQGGSRLGSILWSAVCPEVTP